MKKILIVTAVITVLAVALGVAGYAYAQSSAPAGTCPAFGLGGCTGQADGSGYRGQGMMGGRGGMMGGRGAAAGTYGPMHEYMLEGFSAALGISEADLQTKLDAGETMWTIAEAQGKTLEDFQTLMLDVRSKAVEQAVAAGTLTQEQADWMAQRWEQMQANGFGPGTGTCPGMGSQQTGRGGRWNTQP